MAPEVLVLGGNFAGPTAALSVKQELGEDVDVTVVSKSDRVVVHPLVHRDSAATTTS
jgi:NADH dehydrogenase FAD-containing subunit